jgi:iron-sulfur cluster repair protein YtfE (RIC family)
MTTDGTPSRQKTHGKVDFSMMYFSHDAFKRDLQRMADAVRRGRATDPAVRNGWATFKKQLHIHHVAEDECIWPPLREKLDRPGDQAVMDLMEAEHGRIDPLLDRVDAALDGPGTGLAATVDELAESLAAHMDHEEDRALPLVETYLGPAGWESYIRSMRRTQGLRGGGEYLSWLLDGAPESTQKQVLGMLPPPVRVLFRTVFRPAYARTPRWDASVA